MVGTSKASIVIGVFDNLQQANSAISELLKAGFKPNRIGFAMREGAQDKAEAESMREAKDYNPATRISGGAALGGVIGGLLGALTSIVLPGVGPLLSAGLLLAGGGAIAGGFAGLMSTMEFSEEEIRFFQSELEAGKPVVAVQAGDRYSEALAILSEQGAYDINRRRVGDQTRAVVS